MQFYEFWRMPVGDGRQAARGVQPSGAQLGDIDGYSQQAAWTGIARAEVRPKGLGEISQPRHPRPIF